MYYIKNIFNLWRTLTMKRVFISQPMRGKTDEEILAVKEACEKKCKALFPDEEITFTSGFFKPDELNVVDREIFGALSDVQKPVWCLGKSIRVLGMSDAIYFADDWKDARGCVIEHDIAVAYGYPIIMNDEETELTASEMASEYLKDATESM